MDINAQIKILENLLRKPENRECADCNSKTPRWASITFGTFVCLRCSGMHRQLQVHITKIKSVNLDKWQPEMVEMYKHVNNHVINTYWEQRMPKTFQKPGQSASSTEVETFIKDKYIHKKWVENVMVADPAYLYWHDRKKFNKYINKLLKTDDDEDEEEEEEESDDEAKKKHKKDKKKEKKKNKKDHEKEKKPKEEFIKPPSSKQQVPMDNLINLDSQISHPAKDLLNVDDFQEFQDTAPQNDGFDDFQGAGSQQQNQNNFNPGVNIQGIMNMYSQTPQPNKYSAFDALGSYPNNRQQQNQFGAQQNQYQQPGGFGAQQNQYSQQPASYYGYNQQQQQQQQPMGLQTKPMGQFQPSLPGQQTNMFAGQNMTINVNQYQNPAFGSTSQPFQHQQQQQFVPNTGGFNQPSGYKPAQPQFQQNQASFGSNAGFANLSPLKTQMNQQQPGSELYGGLVNLNNLGTQSVGPVSGNQFGGFQMGGQTQQQKKDSFGGLMSGQWS